MNQSKQPRQNESKLSFQPSKSDEDGEEEEEEFSTSSSSSSSDGEDEGEDPQRTSNETKAHVGYFNAQAANAQIKAQKRRRKKEAKPLSELDLPSLPTAQRY